MSNCSSGCPSQDHATYGECLRSKSVRAVAISPYHDKSSLDKWDNDLTAYKAARDAGLQPTATTAKSAELAFRTSDAMGQKFNGASAEHQLAQKLVAKDQV